VRDTSRTPLFEIAKHPIKTAKKLRRNLKML